MPATQKRDTKPTTRPSRRRAPTDSYWRLCRKFPLRSIANNAEHAQALAIIDELVDRGFENLDPGEEDYLTALSELIHANDQKQHPIEYTSDGSMLEFLCEQKGVSPQAVADGSGIPSSTLSAVLNGKRRFTRDHIRRVAKFFQIDPAVFAP